MAQLINFAIKSISPMTRGTLAATLLAVTSASAQVSQYGTSVNLDTARKAMVAAVAESRKNSWPMAIAIVDNTGQLVAKAGVDAIK